MGAPSGGGTTAGLATPPISPVTTGSPRAACGATAAGSTAGAGPAFVGPYGASGGAVGAAGEGRPR